MLLVLDWEFMVVGEMDARYDWNELQAVLIRSCNIDQCVIDFNS
jgi:hypothetical protein